MSATATYGGALIFGRSVSIQEIPNESGHQTTAVFGLDGLLSLYGGIRGRTFRVQGVLWGANLAAVVAAVQVWRTYDDGVARELVDNHGRSFGSVVYRGEMVLADHGPKPVGGGGIGWPYTLMLHGLA